MLQLLRGLFLAIALSLMGAQASLASPIVYEFTGTVTFQNGDFAGQGSVATGTIQFDDGLTDGNANADVAQYNKTLAANASLAAVFSYSLTVGSVTKTNSGDLATVAWLQLFDDETQPNDQIQFRIGSTAFDYFTLQALQGSGTDLVLPQNPPGGFNPMSDILSVMDGLDPTQFGSRTSTWGGGTNQVQFTWDSITRVPEPSTGALLGLSLFGLLFGARRR
jgi:hypothetical protein